jgi:PGF-CTERM protein
MAQIRAFETAQRVGGRDALYRNNGTETYDADEDSVAYESADGADVSDTAYVYFEEPSRGSDTGASTTDAETTDAAMSDGGTADETTEDSTGGVPGFTPITAVVALLAAALLGLRRD